MRRSSTRYWTGGKSERPEMAHRENPDGVAV